MCNELFYSSKYEVYLILNNNLYCYFNFDTNYFYVLKIKEPFKINFSVKYYLKIQGFIFVPTFDYAFPNNLMYSTNQKHLYCA